MKKMTQFILLGISLILLGSFAQAQSIQERLSAYGKAYAIGYLQPFEDAFGAGMNSGWYSSANVDDGLSLFLGAKIMAMPVPDDSKMFNDPNGNPSPTVFGPDTGTGLKGLNLKWAALAAPQISVGNFYSTRLMLRYFPKTKVGDMGDLELFGIGVQHGINKYFPTPLPVDLAGMVAYQSFKIGSFIDASSFTFGAQASKTFSVVDLYAGLAYETSTMKVTYTQTGTSSTVPPIDIDLSGKNSVRLTAGFALNLLIFKINADYSLASQPVATLGIGLGW